MIAPAPETPIQKLDVDDLRALARGEQQALARIYDRHAPVLLALGVRLLGERREAEDIVHDCFVEAWRHAGEYDATRASVKTWLVLRMRSRCLDRLRSAGHTRRESMTGREEAMMRMASSSGGDITASPEADRVDAHRLKDVLAGLPQDQREVIVLGFFDGLSSSEIASELGIPIGTVKSRVRSAMIRLRAALGIESK